MSYSPEFHTLAAKHGIPEYWVNYVRQYASGGHELCEFCYFRHPALRPIATSPASQDRERAFGQRLPAVCGTFLHLTTQPMDNAAKYPYPGIKD